MDPNLIRGQFHVLGLSLGGVAPTVRLLGLSHAAQDIIGVQLHLEYDDRTHSGFSITIGGAELSLTGTEADDASFANNKLWYPFEVTIYDVKLCSNFGVDVSIKKREPHFLHKPPPPSALHELQMGRLKAARDASAQHNHHSGRGSTDSLHHFGSHPHGVKDTSLLYRRSSALDSTSPPLTKSLLSEVMSHSNASHSIGGGGRRQGGGFGLAYASRRVHYPKWPRGGGNVASTASRASPSQAPLTPSQASHANGARANVGMVNAPSLLSLEGGSFNDAQKSLSSPSNSVSQGFGAAAGETPERAQHPLTEAGLNVRLSFSSPPEVDFSLSTNFSSLRGADEQVRHILKSLLKPKLEQLLSGIVICLPEGKIEMGKKSTQPPAYGDTIG